MAVLRLIMGLLLSIVILMPSCTGNPVREQINIGDRYMSQQQWDNAITAYEKAIAMDPDIKSTYTKLAFAYNNRGWAYNGKELWDDAIQDFEKAIQYKPDFYIALNNRGFAYNGRGQSKLSEAYAILDIEGDKEKAEVIIKEAAEEFILSINDLKEALRLKSNFKEVKDNLAISYNDLGHSYNLLTLWTDAILALNEAIALNPELARAYNNRGWAYDGKTEWEKAVPDCTKAIELDPDMELAYNNRGWAYHELDEYSLALDDLNKAIELAPDLAVAYLNRGITYFYMGNEVKAEADFRKVLELTKYPDLVYGAKQGLALLGISVVES